MKKAFFKKYISVFLAAATLMLSITGCQGEEQNNIDISRKQNSQNDAKGLAEETTEVKEIHDVQTENVVEKDALIIKAEDINDTYWRAVYFETFPVNESDGYVTEYSDAYYRFMDVYFSADNTAELRSIAGESYEPVSGKAEWRIPDSGEIVLEDMKPFDGMDYCSDFVPRFYQVNSEYAPNNEEGLLALEYMDDCVYFKKMEKNDPYEDIDLANANRLKKALEQYGEEGLTGEWVLLSGETEGYVWYALESGIECTLNINTKSCDYSYKDAEGYNEAYYGMKMTYFPETLYTDFPCDYSISFSPDPAEYKGKHERLQFSMAPNGENLIVLMFTEEEGFDYPLMCMYTFQRGFG